MILGRLRARTLRERVVLLLLPALAFRLLFPAGFMPRFGDDFELSMQMCHGDRMSSAIIRVLEDPPVAPGDEHGRHDAPCAFAAVSAFAALEPAPAALEASAFDSVPPAPSAPAPALRVTHRPQSPRAPPLPV